MGSPRRTVHRMVAKYGTSATVTRTEVASVSTSGTPTTTDSITTDTLAAFLPLTEYTDNREEQRSLAARGVRYVVMDAAGMMDDTGAPFVPKARDVLAIGDDSYEIESSTPVDPTGSTPIAHQALAVKL